MSLLAPPTQQQPLPPQPIDPGYTVGTLTYTKAGLIAMVFWMMVGGAAFSLMESVFPSSITLQLKRLGVPEQWMPIMIGTVGQVINFVISPIVSFRSDRTRSRWGRRIPYILATMPPLCLCLVALGFTDDIGRYIRHSAWPAELHLSPLTLIILFVGLLITLFQFFNDILNTVYWYLFADVVPIGFLGRFNGISGVVSSGCGVFFSAFIYGKIQTDTRQIYIGAAALYLVGTVLMCWKIREGQYPTATDEPPHASRWRTFVSDVQTYLRECFCHPLYIAYYIYNALLAMANACSFAVILFFIYDLGFSMDHMGKFGAILSIGGMLIAFPIGWFIDRIHPIYASLLAISLLIPANFVTFFMGSFAMYMVVQTLRLPIGQLARCAQSTLNMRLMPKKQYGQFCSANDLVRSFTLIFGGILGGFFIHHYCRLHGNGGYAYFWLWSSAFDVAALICLFIVYLYWRKMGGTHFSFDAEVCAVGQRTTNPQPILKEPKT